MSVPLEIEDGYVALEAEFLGVRARVLLDTGADVTVVTPALADRIGLEPTAWHAGGVAGGKTIRVPLASLSEVVVGGTGAALDPVAIVDLGVVREKRGPVDAVLGSDFLCRQPFTLDYPASRLVFETPASLAERERAGVTVPLRIENGRTPFLTVRIDDRLDAAYKLDTGAGTTQVRSRDLEALGVDLSGAESVQTEGLGGRYSYRRARLESLSVGAGLEVQHLPVHVQDTELGFVGGNYLSRFALTLDYAAGRAVFRL